MAATFHYQRFEHKIKLIERQNLLQLDITKKWILRIN